MNSNTGLADQTSRSLFSLLLFLKKTTDIFLFSALALDIALKEIAQNGHDEERMVLVFNALDQIIPQLGVFSSIAAALRNELFGIRKQQSDIFI